MGARIFTTFVAPFFLLLCCSIAQRVEGTTVSVETAVPDFVFTVADACAKADFDPASVRQILLEKGFIEEHRPLQHQLEKYPEGGNAFAQGVQVPWKRPCKPSVDSRHARPSLVAAAQALISNGFTTADGLFFEKGSKKIRLQSRGLSMGGPAEINISPFKP